MARIPAELGLTAEELVGLMTTSWTVLENAGQEDADPHLEEVRWLMGAKYAGGHVETPGTERIRYPQTASGRSAR